MSPFTRAIVRWQPKHGRNGLPWQHTRDPYRVWVSEIMLQQTQVEAVAPYYARFLARFPDVRSLARARDESVLRLWSGLGYYARARNLHAAAQQIAKKRNGRFPRTAAALAELPGIGRSTAAAIAVFAFGRREAILDGNVKRVLARRFGVGGYPGSPAVQRKLWSLAQRLVPKRSVRVYTQGLMDLGATICRRSKPLCDRCPVAGGCVARREGRIEELPAPRPRPAPPLRRANWLVAVHDGRVLLERRPSSGLWGGLWTFPEFESGDARAVARTLGCEAAEPRQLPVLEHAFTHFRLRAQPWLCKVRSASPRRDRVVLRWVELGAASEAAVPAPVRRLLRQLPPQA